MIMPDLDSIPFGRTTSTTSTDLKYKVMAYLREGIKRNEVVKMIDKIKEGCPNAEKTVVEALQTKFVEDGRNLLMHAAAYGSRRGFIALVKAILERKKNLGNSALVRQLRELDEDGAPLLFHAVGSNSVRCLKTVLCVLKNTLGAGGLDEQLHAIDHKGRNLLMFAVRGPSFKVYGKIIQELRNNDLVRKRPLPFDQHDSTGRSLLHYAAEGDCPKILQDVVKRAKECPDLCKDPISGADDKGTTPVMYVLRDSYRIRKNRLTYGSNQTRQPGWRILQSSSEELYRKWKEEDARRAEQREQKLDILLNEMEAGEQLDSLTQPPPVNNAASGEFTTLNGRSRQDGLTALMHAARGGRSAFDLAVKKIKISRANSTDGLISSHIDSRFLDLALGVDGSDEKRDRRRGMLLEEAAIGGDLDVMGRVVVAIDPSEDPQASEGPSDSKSNELYQALESINDRGSCLLTSAIKSCDTRMVKWTAGLINRHYKDDSKKAWDRLRGNASEKSSLACAASTPATVKNNGRYIFNAVLGCLRQAALKRYAGLQSGEMGPKQMEAEYVNELLRDELVVTREPKGRGKISPVSPLGGAVLQSNQALFKRVYDEYTKCGGRWIQQQILDQLHEESIHTRDIPEAYTIANDGGIVANVPAQMWHTVVEASTTTVFKRHLKRRRFFFYSLRLARTLTEMRLTLTHQDEAFDKAYGDASRVRWRECFSRTAQTLAERGDLTQIRALVKEKISLHTHIPVLLERIGDYEENVIETVVLVVVHASNPLVVWAGASRDIIKAEVNLPMYKTGLRRLRDRLDTLIIELLDHLPHTVRGVGRELHGSHEPSKPILSHTFGDLTQQRNRDRMIGYLGFVVVRWMLEPSLASDDLTGGENDNSSEMLDPLQHALDRGSNCLAFVNSALVLDYLHLKFWNALPSWTTRNPFHDAIPTAFYTYEGRPSEKSWLQTGSGELLRFLQGWDKARDVLVPAELASSFPHSTLFPGLQFTLAGIIGNPVAFFAVPFVRFIFELMSYIVMLGLFCASVSIQKSDEIPPQECIFYVFVLGLFWREFLEFKEALPARPAVVEDRALGSPERSGRRSVCCLLRPKGRLTKRRHRVASAISRYLFYDTWNILDTITIVVVAAAFVFRILALGEGWSTHEQGTSTSSAFSQNYVFSAQLCLSFSAPLLFSRVLFLSQIDGTLGPLTQVIWVMMSHLARFTVLLLVVMASFALAFHALFFTCEEVGTSLDDAFGTFWQSLLTMFESMLGSFDFDLLRTADECNRPYWAYEVSVLLLVGYMVIMAILLLNLLIAVMATAHSAVDANAEEEFQLSRAKLILQTSRGVANGRLPTPCNLIGAAMGCLVDIPHAVRLLGYAVGIFKEYSPTEPLPANSPASSVNDGSPKSNRSRNAKKRKDRTGRGTPGRRSVDDGINLVDTPHQPHNGVPAPSATVIPVTAAPDSAASARGATAPGPEMSFMQPDNESSHSDSPRSLPAGEKTIPIKPFTTSYSWQTVEGGRDRLIFTLTMGVTAVVASAVLWVISIPWLAWRILRWFFPAGTNRSKGYTWNAGSAVVKFLGWLLLFPATLVYCCTCVLASAILWLWGLCSVFDWVYWRLTVGYDEFLKRNCRFVLPSEEKNKDWSKARDIAKARNYTQKSTDSEQFNVGPLLKMTTGMDVEQLALRIKLRAEEDRLKEYVASSLPGTASESLDSLQGGGEVIGRLLASRSISTNSGGEPAIFRQRTV